MKKTIKIFLAIFVFAVLFILYIPNIIAFKNTDIVSITNSSENIKIPETDDVELRNIFNDYNKRYFNNELSLDHIFYYPIGNDITGERILGQFITIRYNNPESTTTLIRMSDIYKIDKDETFRGALIHEMCHLWEWQNYKSLDHDTVFDNKIRELVSIYGIALPLR